MTLYHDYSSLPTATFAKGEAATGLGIKCLTRGVLPVSKFRVLERVPSGLLMGVR